MPNRDSRRRRVDPLPAAMLALVRRAHPQEVQMKRTAKIMFLHKLYKLQRLQGQTRRQAWKFARAAFLAVVGMEKLTQSWSHDRDA